MVAALTVAAAVVLEVHDGGGQRATGTSANAARRSSVPGRTAILTNVFCSFPRPGPALPPSHHCIPATPATLLPPGLLTVASGVAPHNDPWIFSLQRLRAQGLELLCPQLTPIGASDCFPYPGQPNADAAGNEPLSGSPPVWLTPGGEGTCAPPRWNVITGLVMRLGLSVWFKTPTGTRRIPLVPLDARFRVPGGAFATIITAGPVTLLARDAAGRIVYTAPVTNLREKPSFCGGLDGGKYSRLDVSINLKPHLIDYPFGRYVIAPTQ